MTALGWHVLASLGGYTTQGQSADVTADETRALETLGFGQTDQVRYLDSLAQEPALFGRPLVSGRYAVTRCLRGDPDSAGRTTLRFVSVLFEPQDWFSTGAFALASLAGHRDVWRPPLTSARGITATLTKASLDRCERDALLGLADAWLTRRSAEVVALDDSSAHRDLVFALPGALPERQRASIRWGVRLLSPGVGAEVAVFDAAADLTGRRRVTRWDPGRALVHPYALALRDIWRHGGEFPDGFRDGCADANRLQLTIDQARAQPRVTRGVADPIDVGVRPFPRRLWWHAGLALAAVIVVVAAVAVLARTKGPDTQRKDVGSLPLTPRGVGPAGSVEYPEAVAMLAEFDERASWTQAALREWIQKSGSLNIDQGAPIFTEVREARASAIAALRWLDDAQTWLGDTSDTYEPCDRSAVPKFAEACAALASELEAGRALLSDPRALDYAALDRSDLSKRVKCMTRVAFVGLFDSVREFSRRLPPMRAMGIAGVPLGLGNLKEVATFSRRLEWDRFSWRLHHMLGSNGLPRPPMSVAVAQVASVVGSWLDVMPHPVPPAPGAQAISRLTLEGAVQQAESYLGPRHDPPDVGLLLDVYGRLVNRDGGDSLDQRTIKSDIGKLRTALGEWFANTVTAMQERVAQANTLAEADPPDETAMRAAMDGLGEEQEDVALLRAIAGAGLGQEEAITQLLKSMASARTALEGALKALRKERADGAP